MGLVPLRNLGSEEGSIAVLIVEGFVAVDVVRIAQAWMVRQVCANRREVDDRCDVKARQDVLITDAGEHQYLGSVHSSSGKNDFLVSLNLLSRG